MSKKFFFARQGRVRGNRHWLQAVIGLLVLVGVCCCKGRRGGGEGNADHAGNVVNQDHGTGVGDSGNGDSLVYWSGTVRRKKIGLPDGSEIVMNAGAVIRLSREFNGKTRELWLEGEALFNVSPDAGKPFIVHTRNLKILVLGTRFKVDADPKTAGEEVDLLSGKLQVMKSYHSDSDNEPETLASGEMVMINRDIDLMEKEKMDGSEMKAWDAGK
jgi:ferric-dicitrate binding protein FerR (iron transport regulator)